MKLSSRRLILLVLWIALFVALALPVARGYAADQYITNAWYAQYWKNMYYAGQAIAIRHDPAIDFYWGLGIPDALIGEDEFAARWTRSVYFPAGVYRFTGTMDDGMRAWIDDVRIFDQWKDSAEHTVSKDVTVSEGWHNLKVEYYDRAGVAVARFDWTLAGGGNTYPNWQGEYFNNQFLNGAPAVVRDDRYLDFSWGIGAPELSLPADGFSARWNRTYDLPAGQYRLKITSDDGSRVYINDQLVLDNWAGQPMWPRSTDYWHGGGPARVRVEYFEAMGPAAIRLDFIDIPGGEGILPQPTPTPTPPPTLPDGTVSCPVLPTAATAVVISARPLNFRSGPSLEAPVTTQLSSCQVLLITGITSPDGQWTELILDNGQLGWSLSQYLHTTADLDPGAVG